MLSKGSSKLSPNKVAYNKAMSLRFWNTVLAINSCLWFISLGFLSYGFGMLIVALEWRLFILSVAAFAAFSLTEVVLTALAHD